MRLRSLRANPGKATAVSATEESKSNLQWEHEEDLLWFKSPACRLMGDADPVCSDPRTNYPSSERGHSGSCWRYLD